MRNKLGSTLDPTVVMRNISGFSSAFIRVHLR